MAISTFIFVCVTLMVADQVILVESTHYEYQVYPNCSVSVLASDVEKYQELRAKSTKLIYIHFVYKEKRWRVVEFLHNSKYLLALGYYETYTRFIFNIFTLGIRQMYITIYSSSKECLVSGNSAEIYSMRMVFNNFSNISDDRTERLKSFSKQVCYSRGELDWLCFKPDESGKDIVEPLDLSYMPYFNVTLKLMEAAVFWLIMVYICKNAMHRIEYVANRNNAVHRSYENGDIDIEVCNDDLIRHNCVPSNVISALHCNFTSSIFSIPDSFIAKKNHAKISSGFLSKLRTFMYLFFLIAMWSLFIVFCFYSISTSDKFVLITLINSGIFISVNITHARIIHRRLIYSLLSKDIVIALFISIPCYLFYKFPSIGTSENLNRLKRMLLYCCIIPGYFLSCLLAEIIYITFIGITVNMVPYAPLIMAGIVYWLKVNARVSNWHTCFFKSIVDFVTTLVEEKSLEAALMSKQNCFLIVQSQSSTQIQDERFQVNGTLIFIDENSELGVTKYFFERCIDISNTHLQNNSFRISMESVRQLFGVYLFLFFMALIITCFDVIGELSPSYLSFVTLASGALPFLIDNFIVKDIPTPDINTDIIFKCYIEKLVYSHSESFKIMPSANCREQESDPGQNIPAIENDVSLELTDLATSNHVIDMVDDEDDSSERSPLLSSTTSSDEKTQINIEEVEWKVQGDPDSIDIK